MKTRQPRADKARLQSFPITQSDRDTLARLSQDASDIIGRGISQSAVVRALIRYANRQRTTWAQKHVFPIIEREMQAGVLGGRQKKEVTVVP